MSIRKNDLIHLGCLCLSALILGIGCTCFVKADLGGDAMTTLMIGLNETFAIPLSYGNLLINITMFVLAFLIERKQIGIGSVFYPFCTSLGMLLGEYILPTWPALLNGMLFLFGLFLLCFAIALGSKCTCGKNPYDALCFALMDRFTVKYNIIRSAIDGLMLISGIWLGGPFSIGTLINVMCVGTIAMILMKWLDHWHWLMSLLDQRQPC